MKDLLNTAVRKIPAWPIYLLLAIPLAIYTYWLFTNNLGPDPIRAYEHEMGETALQLIVAGLLISPLRSLFGVNLIKYRRAIGLFAFYYTLAHLAAYIIFDQSLDFAEIWKDIIKRPYITFGMIAVLLLVPMALTSNNWMIRKLGPRRWRLIHRGVYIVAVLAVVHYLLLTKTISVEQIIYALIITALLGYRLWGRFQKARLNA